MIDYLVVGFGLAGMSFCEQLEKNDKTFKVISDESQTSSMVAAGMYNPVILKRFTLAWMAKEQLDIAIPFYGKLEEKLQVKLNYSIPVLRRFATIGEQNLWFEAAEKANLSPFMSTTILPSKNKCLSASFGYGEVLHTGRINTKILLEKYKNYLLAKNCMLIESLNYDVFSIQSDHIEYKGTKAKQIVFAEGYGLKANPFFNYLPLNGTKGELLIIKAPQLKENSIVKSSIFIAPLKQDLYLVGATYKWEDKSNLPTLDAKEELLNKLDTFLKCSYEVIDHFAGIRPTVADRHPLVGKHPEYHNLYVLNGFGSRGVMIAPYASSQLFKYIENKEEINPEMDIVRFTKKHYRV